MYFIYVSTHAQLKVDSMEKAKANLIKLNIPKYSNQLNCKNCFMASAGDNGELTKYPLKLDYFPAHKKGANCSSYISSKNGDYGEKGKILKKLLFSKVLGKFKYPHYFDTVPNDIKTLCPSFKSFSNEQKVNFWIWFYAALSLDESTCGADLKAQGVNGLAVGDFQMEKSHSLRVGGGRPSPECFTGDISAFENNASCSVAILNKELGKKENMFSKPTYWAKLRKPSGNVYNVLRKYPRCY